MQAILAEVADKEPTMPQLLAFACLVSVMALLLGKKHFIAGLAFALIPTCWALAVIEELRDPFVGPAIERELGRNYVVIAHVCVLAPFLFLLMGIMGISPWSGRPSKDSFKKCA